MVLVVVITCLATARLDLYLLSNLDVGADERCGHVAQTLTKNLDGSVTQAKLWSKSEIIKIGLVAKFPGVFGNSR